MKAGPKTAVDSSPLPLRGSRRRELAVARFATDYYGCPWARSPQAPAPTALAAVPDRLEWLLSWPTTGPPPWPA